ncbi:DUF533 domain-containing protein [Comamonadaceae bacterium G21597-S1]|nr:DUF533 domain-containing protein [Comamonadaceae bacterium G21597-S1]
MVRSQPRHESANTSMTPEQQESLLSIALMAAFADGNKAEAERTEIRRIAEMLASEAGSAHLAGVYQDVLLKRVNLSSAAAGLTTGDQRQLAYEMAVCVCEADGSLSDAERQFLDGLRQRLSLDPAQTADFDRQADATLAALDVETREVDAPSPAGATSTAPAGPVAGVGSVVAATYAAHGASALARSTAAAAQDTMPAAPPVPAPPPPPPERQNVAVDDAALERSILNYAILNGALELLPQSWASMAIIPLQVRMVYGIGKAHGVNLDQGHVREFIAAAGVGLTSQYLEQFGRKLLGGLLGKVAGKAGRGVGRAGASMAMSFATTYALGHLARRYYAGGRVMSTALLRETYQGLLAPARQMQTQYLPQIRHKAGTLNAAQVMAMVRGG